MLELCVISLMALIMPWVVGITICLWKFISEKCEKVVRYIELTKLILRIKRMLKESNDNKAVRMAFMFEAKHQRSQLFSVDDLKIWKAFI